MNAEQLDAYEMGNQSGQAEIRLWGAALALLVDDARRYWQGRQKDIEAEQAFDDVCRNGPMLRHCCQWLDTDPEVLSEGFICWCQNSMS